MIQEVSVKDYFKKCFRNILFNNAKEIFFFLFILDILADTHGFEGTVVQQLAVGRHVGVVSSLNASFLFECKIIEIKLFSFIDLRNYLCYSVFKK